MQTAYFYILETDAPTVYASTICKLVYKFWHQKDSLYLHCPSFEVAQQFDTNLWTFMDTGFIPHCLLTDESSQTTKLPICFIGFCGLRNYPSCKTLFNLDKSVPTFFDQYPQIIEVVTTDSVQRTDSREHYKHYQKAGYTMKTEQRTL